MRARTIALMLAAGFVSTAGGARAQPGIGTLAADCASYPCGRVESIRQTKQKQTWTPLGAGIGTGANLGGPTGGDAAAVTSTFKIGPGLSNQGIVLLGAAGGAQYTKTPKSYEQVQWEVSVKLDGGRIRTVTMRYEPFVREGDRVRVVGSNVELVE